MARSCGQDARAPSEETIFQIILSGFLIWKNLSKEKG
jgi:hypothetical protein